MKTIAFLGMGAMGSRMATRLIQAGYQVRVWNRTADAAKRVAALGAVEATTPRDAATGANVLISMLRDDAASRYAWFDQQAGVFGAKEGASPLAAEGVAIESSTLSLEWVRELSATLAARGVRFIDAPVAGSRPQAEAGQLIFMTGGDAQTIDAVRPILSVMGGAVHHLGDAGSGAAMKLAVNALFGIQVAAIAELLALLGKTGVAPSRALEALRTMPVMSPAAAGAAGLMLADNVAPQFPIDLVVKDFNYVSSVDNTMLPVTSAAANQFKRAQEAGYGALNIVAVRKVVATSA